MIKKHITNRIISLFMVILLLPWSVFVYSENAKASIQIISSVNYDTDSETDAEMIFDDATITPLSVMNNDMEVNDLYLSGGSVFDLCGYTLTIHGNLYHSGKHYTIINGTVIFAGESKLLWYYVKPNAQDQIIVLPEESQADASLTLHGECLVNGNLDLNGHKLDIKENLIHSSGRINVNGGSLIIGQDYRMQTRTLKDSAPDDAGSNITDDTGSDVPSEDDPESGEGDVADTNVLLPDEDEIYVYGSSTADLFMKKSTDLVRVQRNFYCVTDKDNQWNLLNGVLDLQGNMYISEMSDRSADLGWDDFCVRLSGKNDQTIAFNSEMFSVPSLELANQGVVLAEGYVKVYKKLISDYRRVFSGTIILPYEVELKGDGFSGSLIAQNMTFDHSYHIGGDLLLERNITINAPIIVEGDFYPFLYTCQVYSDIMVKGDMEYKGNYYICGTINLYDATICVEGNVDFGKSLTLNLKSEDSILDIHGNLTSDTAGDYSAGTLTIGGDFCVSDFQASGTNRVILNSLDPQTITIGKKVKFATLETLNPSEDGVLATAPFEVDRLIRNGYRFRYIDEEGNEREFTDADDFVPVKDLSAEEGVSFITLSFSDPNENPEAAGYDILRSTDGESFFKVASVKKFNASVENETGEGSPDKTEPVLQSYTDQNLQPDTTYYYKVIAFDHFWNRADESDVLEVHTLPDTTAPTVPAGLRVTMRAGRSIGLAWNVSKDDVGLAGYRIYRDGLLLVDEPVTTLRYTDSSLTDDEIHKYSVSAVDASGNESEKSIEIATAAASPMITRVSPETSRFGRESAHFSVFCRNYSNAGSTVRAEYTYDDVLTGNEQSANWVAVSEEETGTIYYSSYEQVADLYWNITGLPSGLVRVRFILRDSSDAETSPYGNIYEYEIDHTSPDAPRIVSADGDGGNIRVTWESSPSSDCAGYVIYRRVLADNQESEQDDPTQSSDENHTQDYGMETDTASDLIKLAEVSSATHEYVDRTLAQGTTALYYVTAVDDLGNESDPAEPALVNAGPDTISPEVKALSPEGGKIGGNTEIKATVQDNCVVKEVQFYIRRMSDQISAQQDEWTLLGTGSEPVISISAGQTTEPVTYETAFSFDTTGFPDGTYQIKAIAFDASGNGSEVADPAVTGSGTEFYRSYEIDNTGISGLGILEQKAGSTFVQLTWNSVDEEDFDYFLVEQMMDSEAVYKEVARENSYTGCTISNLTPETAYTFRVCAVDTVGNKGEYTEPVTVTTLPDETAPVIRSIGPSQGRVRDILPLTMTVTDNYMASYAVWSLSFDGENFTELVRTDQSGTVRESGTDEERTWSFDLDLSDEEAYPEGKIYIRFEAYDAYENHSAPLPDGSEVVAEYEIDRTAPDQPRGIRGVGYDGYISVTWENGAEEDIRTYQVYRTEMTGSLQAALAEGRFTCVMDAANLNYYDTDVEDGKSYAYYVTAKDEAGNISVRSEVIFATALPDETEPVVAGVSPKDGTTIGKETRFSVIAKDNSNLSCMRVYYRRADSGLWTLLREEEISGTIDRIDFTSNFSNEEEGTIQFKTVLEDRNGNVSEDFITTCTLDKTPPTAELTAANGHFENILTLTRDPLETDFYYYEIYRCELSYAWNDLQFYSRAAGLKKLTVDAEDPFLNGDGRRSLTWIDKDVIPGENYRYAARVYDKAGNYSWTEIGDAKADSLDAVEPVIVFPDMVTGLEGRDIVLDAGECYDNVNISDYFWDIQGSNIQEENSAPARGVRHTVRLDAGKHTATLTVKDRAGNTSSKTFTIRVKEPSKTATCHLTLIDTNGMPIPFAYVYIQAGGDADQALMTDAGGKVDLTYKRGRYKVAAFKDGYLPAEKEIEITQDIIDRCNSEDFQYRETLTLSSGEVVVGEFEVHQMSLQEMEEAGVDFSDPANLNTFTFRTVLTFQSTPLPVVVEDIPLDPEVIFDDELKGDGFQTQNFTINLSGGKEDHKNQPVTKVTVMTVPAEEHIPIVAIMTTTQSVSWLKSMYSANLTITNMADNQYVLEDSTATIELPDGISLAALKNDSVTVMDAILEPTQTESENGEAQGQDDSLNPQPIVERETGQKLTIDMGDIPGQTSRTASWVLRGDKSGSYDISALYTGILTPFRVPISKEFRTDVEVEKSNVEIKVMPENSYYLDEDYYIQYAITNKGDEPLYNFTTTIGDYRMPGTKEEVLIADPETGEIIDRQTSGSGKVVHTVPVDLQMYHTPVLSGSDRIMVPTLKPGQTIYGTWKLGEGDFEALGFAGDPNTTYFRLIDTLVEVIEGQNLGVHVVVDPIPSHVLKYISRTWVGEQEVIDVGDPVDMSSGAFRDSITALSLTGRDVLSAELHYDSEFAADAGEAGDKEDSTAEGKTSVSGKEYRNTCGYGWYTDYDTWIEDGNGMLRLYLNPYVSIPFISNDTADDSNGNAEHRYKGILSGTEGYVLVHNSVGEYTLEAPNGAFITYDAQGRLSGMTSPEGNHVTVNEQKTEEEPGESEKDDTTASANNDISKQNYDQIITEDISGVTLILHRDETGRLLSVSDTNGRVTMLHYSNAGDLAEIIDPLSETISYTYTDHMMTKSLDPEGQLIVANAYDTEGRVKKQELPSGASIDFTYSVEESSGCLTAVSMLSHDGTVDTTTVISDSHGRILHAEDASGSVDYEYDENGDLILQKGSDGSWFSYAYDTEGRVIKTDSYMGDPTEIMYDETGNPVQIKKAGENNTGINTTQNAADDHDIYTSEDLIGADPDISTFRYDAEGRLIEGTAKGNKAGYTYGADGLLATSTIEGRGTCLYQTANGRLTAFTNELGAKTLYEHDAYGNVSSVTDPAGGKTVYGYDAMNRKISVTDPRGNTTGYTYNALGFLATETDPLGNTTAYEYDAAANLTGIILPNQDKLTLSYDMLGRLVGKTFPDGTGEQYVYDAAGNVVRITYADGTTEEITYNKRKQITAITNAAGITIGYTFNEQNQLTGITSAGGASMQLAYMDGNVTSIYPAQNSGLSGIQDGDDHLSLDDDSLTESGSTAGISFTYDSNGNVIEEKDPMEHVLRHTYDRFGNKLSDIDANGNTTSYTYDAIGRCISMTYPNGLTIEREYDRCGNVAAERTEVSGRELVYTYIYDKAGYLIESRDESNRKTMYQYDKCGRLVRAEDEFGNYIEKEYDCLGRVTRETDNTGAETEYTYDQAGNLSKVTYTAEASASENTLQNTTETTASDGANLNGTDSADTTSNSVKQYLYTYDKLGRLLTVTDPMDNVSGQAFDVLGQVTSVTDSQGGTTTYEYDKAGNIVKETNAIGVSKTYEYDAYNNLIKATDGRGNVTTIEYDLCGRISSFTDPEGTVSCTYDENGNVLTVSDKEGTITRTYDNMDRVTSVTDVNGKTVKYGYDEIGNILSITYPGGEIVRYSYNPDSSLESFVDGAGRKTSYTYDEQGRRETVTRPDGSVETTTYNDKNQVGSVEDRAKDGTILQKTEYTYDGWGNITSIKETVKPDYDVDHTPESLGVGAEEERTSTEETEVQETDTKITTVTTTNTAVTVISSMEYNEANQLIRFNGHEVRYDEDGNMTCGPLNGKMADFTYDCRNRLITAGGASYRYDAENVRISVETDEYKEEYVTDRVYPLSRTLEITRTDKSTKKTSLTTCYYGTGLVYDAVNTSDKSSANNSKYVELRAYHFDHLGSTRYVTDKDGKVTLSFYYGTYGESLGCYDQEGNEVSLSALKNPVRFLYNGELGVTTDDNTLLYMRQRYYNTEIKRFINQDVLTGSITNGLSLNRYSYVEGNPISYTDPFGLSKMRDTLRGIHNTYNVIKNSITHMSPHTVLDLLGTIPGIGSIFDLSNAALYALEGKEKEALESVIFAIPTMDVVGAGEKISKYFGKGGKYVKAIAKVVKLCGTAAAVGIAARRTGEGIASLIDDYAGTGRSLDSEFWLRVAGISVGTVQTTAYGRTLGRDVLQYTSLENKLQNIKQATAEKPHELRNDNKGYVRLDVLFGKGGSKSIKPYEVTTYDDFRTRSVVGDGLEGHEMWQHSNMKNKGYATTRLSTEASRNNPVIALPHEVHVDVNRQQYLFDGKNQTPFENIINNANIMYNNNDIPNKQVTKQLIDALKHLDDIGGD